MLLMRGGRIDTPGVEASGFGIINELIFCGTVFISKRYFMICFNNTYLYNKWHFYLTVKASALVTRLKLAKIKLIFRLVKHKA